MGSMSFSEAIEKFNNSKVKLLAEKIFSSYYFPFVTAAVTVLSTTFGLEPLIIWYICIIGAAICLCCKDVSPCICLFIFMHSIISMQHSPYSRVEWCDPTYMTSVAFIVTTTIAILIFAGSCVYRIVDSIMKHRFKITPIFWGLCAYLVALLLNGLFSSKYYFMDTVYGLGMGAIIMFMFVFISGNVEINQTTYKRIAFTFIAFSITLAIQLLVAYITLDVVVDGVINRAKIQFGWGTYNQFGMLITTCIPAWFYLATKYKNGYLFLLGVPINLLISVFSMSRQAILMSLVLVVACFIWYLIIVPKKQKLYGSAIILGSALIYLIVILVKTDEILKLFNNITFNPNPGGGGSGGGTGGGSSGGGSSSGTAGGIAGISSGRTDIWLDGLKKFMHNPIFGNGFYDLTATKINIPGYNGAGYGFTEVIPFMCHNTVIQLLFSCGIVGLIAYVVHRTQTVISLINNPDNGRFFIAFAECGILLTSLLDNHIFYPLSLFIYAPLLAVFTVSEKTGEGVKETDNVRKED